MIQIALLLSFTFLLALHTVFPQQGDEEIVALGKKLYIKLTRKVVVIGTTKRAFGLMR